MVLVCALGLPSSLTIGGDVFHDPSRGEIKWTSPKGFREG